MEKYDYYIQRYQKCVEDHKWERTEDLESIGYGCFLTLLGIPGMVIGTAGLLVAKKMEWPESVALGLFMGGVFVGPTILAIAGCCVRDVLHEVKYEAKIKYYKTRAKLARPLEEIGEGDLEVRIK